MQHFIQYNGESVAGCNTRTSSNVHTFCGQQHKNIPLSGGPHWWIFAKQNTYLNVLHKIV